MPRLLGRPIGVSQARAAHELLESLDVRLMHLQVGSRFQVYLRGLRTVAVVMQAEPDRKLGIGGLHKREEVSNELDLLVLA